ncbi:MAG: protein kinase, partial [Kofleriaceae bacterium]|nr:protein kinase [Kofleriaceae bacterium]
MNRPIPCSTTAECPDDSLLSAFVARTLPAGAAAGVEAHLADCRDCRELVFALTASDDDDAAPVERVGRFELERVIGQGAMGVVYRARDPELERTVALKIRKSPSRLDPDGEERLRREAQALARLAHPNVVAVYEAGRHERTMYIAMEYVEGDSLADWLASGRPAAAVIERMIEAGRGLAAAHAVGLVHRDFKPRNVFVATSGTAKVGDFGLVRLDDEQPASGAATRPSDLTLTLTGSLVGTPAYMAPEQLRGEAATELSDQFSFAITFYEALYGKRPFAGET